MKVAIAVESITGRVPSTFLLESLLNIYPEATIYTLQHWAGKVLGRVETHKIVSTYLSHHKELWSEKMSLVPMALKSLNVDRDTDLVISLSKGYIHALNLPKKTKHVVYLEEWMEGQKSDFPWWSRWMKSGLNAQRTSALQKAFRLAVSSQALQKKFGGTVIPSAFKTDDYFHLKEVEPQKLDGFFVYTKETDLGILKELLATETKGPWRFFGPEERLDSFKGQVELLGEHCAGDASYQSLTSKAVIDLSDATIPYKALGALVTSKAIIVRDNPTNREFLPEDMTIFVKGELNRVNIKKALDELEDRLATLPYTAMRRHGLSFNGRIFKSRIQRLVEGERA